MPVTSRSIRSSSAGENSSMGSGAGRCQLPVASPPNNCICPTTCVAAVSFAADRTASACVSICRRFQPSPSNAPLCIRLSSARLFNSMPCIRSQKSYKSVNAPCACRSRSSFSISAMPTFLTACNPNRMPCFVQVKAAWLSLICGGKTATPTFLQAELYASSFGKSPMTLVINAAIYAEK